MLKTGQGHGKGEPKFKMYCYCGQHMDSVVSILPPSKSTQDLGQSTLATVSVFKDMGAKANAGVTPGLLFSFLMLSLTPTNMRTPNLIITSTTPRLQLIQLYCN